MSQKLCKTKSAHISITNKLTAIEINSQNISYVSTAKSWRMTRLGWKEQIKVKNLILNVENEVAT